MMGLDDPIVMEFIRRAMVARLATLSRNGRAHVNPLYFAYFDGRLYLGTSDRTLAALNVVANPQATILLDLERDATDQRVLRLHGNATVRKDPDLERRYLRRNVYKYFAKWRGIRNTVANARRLPVMHRYHASGWKGKACVIEFTPESAELLSNPARVSGTVSE